MDATLHNTSDAPLTIRRIAVSGPGVGSVIRILDVKLGPLPENHDSLSWTTGGVFRTYPPVEELDGRCALQALKPVSGFVLRPDHVARVLLLTRAIAVGSFQFRGVDVTYERLGQVNIEIVDFGQRGSVVDGGRTQPRLTDGDVRCAHQRHVAILPASGRPSSATAA